MSTTAARHDAEPGHRRRTVKSSAGSVLFLLVAPGAVAGVMPWALTGWDARHGALDPPCLRVVGAALVVAGVASLVHAFARFVLEGRGTPAPIAPTRQLVVGGLYRFVRNPMYIAVGAAIIGQALILDQASLLAYASVFGVVVAAFVRFYEQPSLRKRFGPQYERYCRDVRAWVPRLRPWHPEPAHPPTHGRTAC